MKFQANSRRRAKEYEADVLARWKAEKTFEQSVENRSEDNAFVFYDGPPFITGVPHHGTLLSSIVKDAVPRYQTMKGKRVERRWGWDTHGLPAENFVEKKLGITSRHEVGEKISLAEYITTARESMVSNAALWESTIDRIGRWVEFKNAYKTMDKNFMESVWWSFKTLYEKGKIYEGERVLMYDTAWATPLSKSEVTMDNDAYKTVTDPSVFVKFWLKDFEDAEGSKDKTAMLAWTTTPWTLPANMGLFVNPETTYAKVKVGDEFYILAKDLLEKVFVDEKKQPIPFEIVNLIDGTELIGLSYEPLFEDSKYSGEGEENAYKVWGADYVSLESGTGIVHSAPAYGEEDFNFGKEYGIPVFHVLDEFGKYLSGEFAGKDVWEFNKPLAKILKERDIVWKIDYIRHEYPHNPRTGQRLMYRAHPSWFFDIQGQKELMIEQNENINWFPAHLKHGRFEKNLEAAPDWNLSRDRFWATAMPVWKSESGKIRVVGSYAELKELSGVELEDYHRPWVDEITFEIDGEKYTRIDKVLDCWFESGSMPFAQFHYPFENKEKFEKNFPGDFIVEYIGQVRAWFYYVHAVNTALFGKNAFKNVITTGVVAGNDGRKMSKSLGNYTDPNELMDQYSADSLRFLLLTSPLLNGEDFALHDKDVSDVARKLSMIWNMYDFFTMYASVDGWEFNGELKDPSKDLENPLDKWIVSRVHELRNEITENMNVYNIPRALEGVLPFLDDASNWFVRRSRRRFWKSENGVDKLQAYQTLHYVLSYLALILAPFVPFLAEELWGKMVGDGSVHLKDWPEAGEIDESLLSEMAEVRGYVNEALALRAKNGVKIRQPLARVKVPRNAKSFDFTPILLEELNVKNVEFGVEGVEFDFELTPELRAEGLMREIIRHIQATRKKAGLNVDDRIELNFTSENAEVLDAFKKFEQEISKEVLATKVEISEDELDFTQTVKVEGSEAKISLKKA
ncbi:isoleucine--tRNA ligase [Candidatus Saccharibacteria bacterium]|nr:isoleucine--tRNA ligase [Candidatus Saccharibacteria bacterium]